MRTLRPAPTNPLRNRSSLTLAFAVLAVIAVLGMPPSYTVAQEETGDAAAELQIFPGLPVEKLNVDRSHSTVVFTLSFMKLAKVQGRFDRFEGTILFEPTRNNSGPSSGGSIEAGHYRVPQADGPAIGTNRVEISVPRNTGRQIPHPANPGATIDEILEAAPPEYNRRSKQVVDVKPGKNRFDFHMKSE